MGVVYVLSLITSIGIHMFTPLPTAPHDPVPKVKLVRDDDNKLWIVRGAHPRTFKDVDHGNSFHNAFVAAIAYSEAMVANGKRAWSTDRNFVLIEKADRAKQLRLYVRITRPTGGYKFFLVNRTTITGEFMGATYEEVRVAASQAVAWFIQERAKCQDAITSKNIAVKNKRIDQRRSLLYGGFIP